MQKSFLMLAMSFVFGTAAQAQGWEWAIEPTFQEVESFSEGLAKAAPKGDGFIKYGFIDKTGAWVIQPQFEAAAHFSEGLAAVKQKGKWGFIRLKQK